MKQTEPTMRTWERVTDVLEDVQGAHERLAEHYASLGRTTEDERARALLQLRADGARHSAAELREYAATMTKKLRETRIQFRLKRSLESLLADADTVKPTLQSVTRLGLQVDSYFEELFDRLQAVAAANGALELQEAFAALRDREKQAKRILARQATTARDV